MRKVKIHPHTGFKAGASNAYHGARAGTALRAAAPHDAIQKVNFFNPVMGAAQRPTR